MIKTLLQETKSILLGLAIGALVMTGQVCKQKDLTLAIVLENDTINHQQIELPPIKDLK